jgi:hypothetical protein
MAALINSLDNITPSNLGENGHSEYTWSNNIRERILQLSFQLTRNTATNNNLLSLAGIVDNILSELKRYYRARVITTEEFLEYMSIMFRLVGQTRDIIDGKGEYKLSYMLLSVWQRHYSSLASFAFQLFVLGDGQRVIHPYGSWKDVKYMIQYMEEDNTVCNPESLITFAVNLMNTQIRQDLVAIHPSLAAKWAPREKSHFSRLFTRLALEYFPEYSATAFTETSINKATTKAKMDYRKIISSLNKKLETVQINQCANTWAKIDPANQTSITMHKQKKAFLNLNKKGEQRSQLEDRIQCANKFTDFANNAARGEVSIKGLRIGLNDFTKNAFELSSEAQILNAQWLNNSLQNGALGKMIAMVDTSDSMSGDPMNAAIALGIRIAEKSMLGKRVLTFSASPTWVNLDGYDNFVSMVEKVSVADWGMNTNFLAALNLILDAIVQQKMDAIDVEDMVLTILSDMQIDAASQSGGSDFGSMMKLIERRYADAGIRVCGKPYKPPHILFWNLRSTGGFPTLSTQPNASMMSGFSPALLNLFCEEGLNALQACSPWSLLVKSLANDRYQVLDERLRQELDLFFC